MNKGGKLLKKLWCCVDGRVEQGHLVLSTELKGLIGHCKELKADVLSVSPLSEQLKELWVVCVFTC